MRVAFWDIDGTLLTTARAGVLALEDVAREECCVDADLSGLETSGLTDARVAELAIAACGCAPSTEAVGRFLSVYEQNLPRRLHARQGSVLPNVREALEELHDRPDYLSVLLTGNTAAGARAKLAHYGLTRYFGMGGFCAGGESRTAIARRALEIASEHVGRSVRPSESVVIGDTPQDVRCGHAIGAHTIAVATGRHSLSELQADAPSALVAELPPPADLIALLDSIMGDPDGKAREHAHHVSNSEGALDG